MNCTQKHLVSEVSVPDLHIHLARREKTCRGCEVNCEVKTLLRLQSVAKEKSDEPLHCSQDVTEAPTGMASVAILLFM